MDSPRKATPPLGLLMTAERYRRMVAVRRLLAAQGKWQINRLYIYLALDEGSKSDGP